MVNLDLLSNCAFRDTGTVVDPSGEPIAALRAFHLAGEWSAMTSFMAMQDLDVEGSYDTTTTIIGDDAALRGMPTLYSHVRCPLFVWDFVLAGADHDACDAVDPAALPPHIARVPRSSLAACYTAEWPSDSGSGSDSDSDSDDDNVVFATPMLIHCTDCA
jgi:hypothetical protein